MDEKEKFVKKIVLNSYTAIGGAASFLYAYHNQDSRLALIAASHIAASHIVNRNPASHIANRNLLSYGTTCDAHPSNDFLALLGLEILGLVTGYILGHIHFLSTRKIRNYLYSDTISELDRVRAARKETRDNIQALVNNPHAQNSVINQVVETPIATNGENTPSQFVCPITQEVMRDPVLVQQDGRSYERSALSAWYNFLIVGREQPRCVQSRNNILVNPQLLPTNYKLKKEIKKYAESQSEQTQSKCMII